MSAWPALVRLSSRRLSELYGMRLARAYAVGITLSFVGLAALLPATSRESIDHFIVDALRSASWVVAGLSALSAARDLEGRDDADGFGSLFALRGAGQRERAWSHWLASALRITAGVAAPALAVLAVGAMKAPRPALAGWLSCWLGSIVLYSVALGVTLASLARASAWLLGRQGRWLLSGAVLVPELLRALTDWPVPSLAAACGAFLTLAEAWARGGA